MADRVVATKSESRFRPHSEGMHLMLCVDVIDLGQKVVAFPDKPSYLAPSCAIIWASGERNEDGTLITVSQDYTVSTSERSNLRKHLEAWRGKPYDDSDLDEGLPLHKLEGKPCLISIAHGKSAKGRTYAKVMSISPPMKGMDLSPTAKLLDEYKRGDYWQQRKDENEKAVKAWRLEHEGGDPDSPANWPEPDGAPATSQGDEGACPF